MTKGLRILVAIVAGTAPGIASAAGWTCRMVQDCELGLACVDLTQPEQAWISQRGEGRLAVEMSGHISEFSELARFENSASFASSPSPNNVLLLTMHDNGTVALTIHYTSAAGFFSNTLRGTCVVQPG